MRTRLSVGVKKKNNKKNAPTEIKRCGGAAASDASGCSQDSPLHHYYHHPRSRTPPPPGPLSVSHSNKSAGPEPHKRPLLNDILGCAAGPDTAVGHGPPNPVRSLPTLSLFLCLRPFILHISLFPVGEKKGGGIPLSGCGKNVVKCLDMKRMTCFEFSRKGRREEERRMEDR